MDRCNGNGCQRSVVCARKRHTPKIDLPVCSVAIRASLGLAIVFACAVVQADDSTWQRVGGAVSGGGSSADGWFKTQVSQPVDHQTRSAQQTVADKAAGSQPIGWRSRVAAQSQASLLQVGDDRLSPEQPVVDALQARKAAQVKTVIEAKKQPTNNSVITISDKADSDTTMVPADAIRPDNPDTQNMDLFAGQIKVINDFDVRRVAIGNGAIVHAEVLDSGELLIMAKSQGSSSLRLWSDQHQQRDYNIRVSANDPQTRIQMQRTVRMRVRMVEFRKSALGRLGIDWSDSVNGPSLAAAGDAIGNNLFRPQAAGFEGLPNTVAPFSTYFGIASNISSRINMMAQNGDAITLAEPVLSAINGGEASFLAGGEVPYPTVGENGQTQVQFKDYGVKLNVAPIIDNAGNVRTTLSTEISQIDTSVSVGGTPGLLTRRAQTELTVQSGKTIVISGLLSSQSGNDSHAIPGLGRLPIIGRFFRSDAQRKELTELVIFVTPEVIEPGGSMITEREQQYLTQSDRRVTRLRQNLRILE